MKKFMIFLFVAALVCSAVGGAAAAAAVVISVEARYDSNAGKVDVTGRISSGGGQAVTIKIVYPQGNLYVNQLTSGEEGEYALSYTLTAAQPGEYRVYAGGAGIAGPAETQFAVSSPSSGEDPGDDGDPDDNGDSDDDGNPGDNGGPDDDDNPDGGTSDHGGNAGQTTTGGSAVNSGSGTVGLHAGLEGKTATAKLDQAVWDALDKSNIKKERKLVFTVDEAAGAEEVRLELPASIMQDAKALGLQRIEIRTPLATFTFAVDAIPAREGKSGKLELVVARTDLSERFPDASEPFGGRPVYDFRLTLDGQSVHPFSGRQAVRVSVPYTVQPGEDPAGIVVCYIDEEGRPEIVRNGKYDRQTGLVTFDAQHFSFYAVIENKVVFTDLASVRWAEDSIRALAAREIVAGTGDGRFSPGKDLTRAEFVKMLMTGLDWTDLRYKSTFTDVPAGAWYEHEAATAAQFGIVSGYGDGTFGGGRAITREEMFVIAARALRAAGTELTAVRGYEGLQDIAQLSNYARSDVLRLVEAGLVAGNGNGRLLPQDGATRAEAAVFLQRVLDYLF